MVVRYHANRMDDRHHQIFIGRIIHITDTKLLEIFPHASLGVRPDGVIAFVEPTDTNVENIRAEHSGDGFAEAEVVLLGGSQFLFPGLIDTHLHAPQWPNLALGMDDDLRKWVEEWTDPMEASYWDNDKAVRVYDDVVRTTLRLGSTTVAYNSSKHWEATDILADTCLKYGQRAIVGKSSSTIGLTKDSSEASTEQSLVDTVRCIQHIRTIDPHEHIVHACVQPRGGPYCPGDLMKGMGSLVTRYDTHVQAHCCETQDDIDRTLKLHSQFDCYTDVYKEYGLLTQKSILAHCIHLQPKDVNNLKKTGAAVAHNPNSNTCLRDGECNVRHLLDAGIKVGLGTDCSAGYLPSIMDAMRQASNVSRHLAIRHKDEKYMLDFNEITYLATLGGARALGLDHKIGSFEVGKRFDALLVDVDGVISCDKTLWQGEEDQSVTMLKKWVFLGESSSIKKVYVDGRVVSSYKRD